MTAWLLCNALFSTLVLLFLRWQGGAPPRLRLLLAWLALLGWVLPWSTLLARLPLFEPASTALPSLSGIALDTEAFDIGAFALVGADLLLWTLLAATGLGLLRFTRQLRAQHSLLQRLVPVGDEIADSEKPALARGITCRFQQQVPGGFTAGLWHPVIWVHVSLRDSRDLALVLLHEAQHVRQHDNFFLLVICAIEALLWWNPLVRRLAFEARFLLEASCDTACARRCDDYRAGLQQLIWRQSRQEYGMGAELVVHMAAHSRLNVLRLRSLERSYAMKVRYVISTTLLLLTGALGASWVAAQQTEDERRALYEDTMERRARGEEVVLSQDQILYGMEVYVRNLEASHAQLQASLREVEASKQEVDAARRQLEAEAANLRTQLEILNSRAR